jgi:hypothetical protein
MGFLECDVKGCKKSKLRKHTHMLGELRGAADYALIEQYRWYAEMTGQPLSIPGGSSADMKRYMSSKVKENDKLAKQFRKNLKKK